MDGTLGDEWSPLTVWELEEVDAHTIRYASAPGLKGWAARLPGMQKAEAQTSDGLSKAIGYRNIAEIQIATGDKTAAVRTLNDAAGILDKVSADLDKTVVCALLAESQAFAGDARGAADSWEIARAGARSDLARALWRLLRKRAAAVMCWTRCSMVPACAISCRNSISPKKQSTLPERADTTLPGLKHWNRKGATIFGHNSLSRCMRFARVISTESLLGLTRIRNRRRRSGVLSLQALSEACSHPMKMNGTERPPERQRQMNCFGIPSTGVD